MAGIFLEIPIGEFFFQNMHFPFNTIFSSSFRAFLSVWSVFKKKISLLIRCWLNFYAVNVPLLFSFFFFSFPLLPLVSSFGSTQPTKASHRSLSLFLPHYCRLFGFFPCWYLMFTALWYICANFVLPFPLCVYITQTLLYNFKIILV